MLEIFHLFIAVFVDILFMLGGKGKFACGKNISYNLGCVQNSF